MIVTFAGNPRVVRPSKRSRALFCIWPNFDVCRSVHLKCPPVDHAANGVDLPENVLLGAESWEALVNGLHICTIPEDRHETWLRRGKQYNAKTLLFLASHFFSRARVIALSDALLALQPYPSTRLVCREEIIEVLMGVGRILPIRGVCDEKKGPEASIPISTIGMN